MAAVFKELDLKWDGKDYTVKPTMRLLNRIEQDVSISSIAYRSMKGEPPVSLMAVVFGIILREAGADVTDEEVYTQLVIGSNEALQQASQVIIQAAYPQLGKPEGKTMPATVKRKRVSTKS